MYDCIIVNFQTVCGTFIYVHIIYSIGHKNQRIIIIHIFCRYDTIEHNNKITKICLGQKRLFSDIETNKTR